MLSKQIAYEKWLGIKSHDQPPTLYRLLAVDAFESDPDAISYAADSRMALLRQFQISENARLAEQILSELSHARVVLLNAEKKGVYDAQLRQRIAAKSAMVRSASLPRALPLPTQPVAGSIQPTQDSPTSTVIDLDSVSSEFRSSISTGSRQRKKKTNSLVWIAAASSVALVIVAIAVFNSFSGGQGLTPTTASSVVVNRSEPLTPPVHSIDSKSTATPSSDNGSDKPSLDVTKPASALPVEPATSAPIVVAHQETTEPDSGKPASSPSVENGPRQPELTSVPVANAPDAPKKAAPPNADQIKQSEATINELYKKQLARPDKDFSQQLLKLAQETKGDLPSQYVLLRKAVEVGAVTADSETVYAAMDALEKGFSLNVVPLWVEALESLSKRADVSDRINAVLDRAYQADDYDSASTLASLWLVSARNAKNLPAIKNATAKVKEVALARDEFKKTAAARQKMEANPNDPEANRIVGSFLCFVKKDWEHGVPMLAEGDDAALKKIASLDLEGDKAVEIGDAWNNVRGGQDRALFWYKMALPSLSGLQKARVAKLVGKLEPKSEWIDLLTKVDLSRDVVAGTWKRNGSELSSPGADQGVPRIMFPIAIEGSYELVVEFSRDSGDDACVIPFPVGKRCPKIVLSTWPDRGTIGGMGNIDGKDMVDNSTTFKPSLLQNGRHYQLMIKVQLAGENVTVEAFLDSQRIVQWKGKSASLSSDITWTMPHPNQAGFGHFFADAVTLYAVRLRRL